MDTRQGQTQVLIRQVVLFHELECNYDESRLNEDTHDPSRIKITSHHPSQPQATITLINEDRDLTDPSILPLEFIKKSGKSKSQLSLSNLEINVFLLFSSSLTLDYIVRYNATNFIVICLPSVTRLELTLLLTGTPDRD